MPTEASSAIPGWGLEVGGGAVLGFVTGFAAKKVAKFVAVLVGLELALFKFLESKGVLTVNWDRLTETSEQITQPAQQEVPSMLTSFLNTIPVGGGFTAGALLGWKKA